MTIQSLSYLLFALIVWLVALPVRSARPRQALLLAASYIFYASWGLGFLAVLVTSSLVNYGLGTMLRRQPSSRRLQVGIGFNLLLLIVFKYTHQLTTPAQSEMFSNLLGSIIMPVGISFWTFQALSYLFDLYREEELDPSLMEFCLYMAFWPTVLSGPVCRLPDMLPQFREAPRPVWDDVAEGTRRIVMGLFMKVVLAQFLMTGFNAGEGVAAGFDQIAQGWGGLDVWLLAVGFGFQLFFDFAGYSHIVIGTARLFGIRLAENFDHPYLSATPSIFWTRWHMSLSFWIRDYIFLPLATARRATWWRSFALVFAMTLFGLWHEASLTFLIWGAYQGFLLLAHRKGQQIKRKLNINWSSPVSAFASWALTFALVSLGWILFRAQTFGQALVMLKAVFQPFSYAQLSLRPNFYIVTSLVVAGYFAYIGIESLLAHLDKHLWARRVSKLLSPLYYATVIFFIIVWSKQETVFVYFQF